MGQILYNFVDHFKDSTLFRVKQGATRGLEQSSSMHCLALAAVWRQNVVGQVEIGDARSLQ